MILLEIKDGLQNCCLTLDGWVSNRTESFLGVTCHYIDKDFEFRSFALDLKLLIESHSTNYIYSQLLEVLEEWEIREKVRHKIIKNCEHIYIVFFFS